VVFDDDLMEQMIMSTDILVPTLGESVTEATVAQWLKKPGDSVGRDEPVVELETDKVTLEVNAAESGVLAEILVPEGENVGVGVVLGRIGEGAATVAGNGAEAPAAVAAAPVTVPVASPDATPAAGGKAIEIQVPVLGESVTEATVAQWLKASGDAVAADEALVELETDKVTLEVNAPAAGVLGEISAEAGATVEVGAVLAILLAGASGGVRPAAEAAAPAAAATVAPPEAPAAASVDQADPLARANPALANRTGGKITGDDLLGFLEMTSLGHLGPAVRKMISEQGLDPAVIPASGPDGRLTKEDVIAFLDGKTEALATPAATAAAPAQAAPASAASTPSAAAAPAAKPREERVRMSKLRQTIARRLKEAQNTAAMLTTFNEVDMSAVMALRAQYRESFEKKHGVRLGFTSFFAKAAVAGLIEIPAVNARIEGDEIVYNKFVDIGMAVSTPNGLMVPVVRDCDQKSFAEIEASLGELAKKGRDGKLSMDEMTGGSFTMTNGGVFGSLLSTPILNMPQSGIMGLHKIENRPVAIDGQVVIRPMMYLALSYDHRVIDGREAVTFLVKVKENIEDPQRLLLDL
jgi:2-oxoglutarate dehydrogenase E2 component (dihydrolipoamide succinyltransferase)